MALTKVSGGILDPGINVAGIVTATGFDGPFTGGSSKHITAGVVTATSLDLNGNGDISGNLVIGGNLTANGDFTTLNTTLREVELLRVDAQNDNVTAGIITQRGTGNILDLYDTSSAVFSVRDGGNIIMGASAGSITPHAPLHIRTATTGAITTLLKLHGPFTSNIGSEGTAIDFGTASDTSTGARIIGSREAAGAKGALRFCTGRENDAGFNDGRMVIASTGSVGIGLSNPTETLTINGSATDTAPILGLRSGNNHNTISNGAQIAFGHGGINHYQHFIHTRHNGSNSHNAIDFYVCDGTQANSLTSGSVHTLSMVSGKVGIGTDNPTQKLEVKYGEAWIDNNSGDSIARSDGLTVSHTTSADFAVASDPGDDRRTATFAVKGSSRAAIVALRNVDDNSAFWDFIADGNTNKFYIQRGGGVAAALGPAVSIDTSLNVGIGTGNTVGARLRVQKDGLDEMLQQWGGRQGPTAGQRFMQLYSPEIDSGSDYFRFQTGNAFKFQVDSLDALCINSAGRVGVGTDLPTKQFHVFDRSLTSTTARDNTVARFLSNASNADCNIQLSNGVDHSAQIGIVGNGAEFYIAQDGVERFRIDINGHILVPDDKQVQLGGSQDLKIYHSNSDNHSYIKESGSGDLLIQATQIKLQDASGSDYLRGFTGGAVYLHNAGNNKFETTSKGVHVTGEVSASQDYPNFRPTLDFNFAAERKLDPRITYSRTGSASYVNEFGKVVLVGNNVPRFDYGYEYVNVNSYKLSTGESKGILIEEQRTNFVSYSIYDGDKSGRAQTSTGDTGNWTLTLGHATLTGGIDAPDGSDDAVRFTSLNTGFTILRIAIPAFTPNGSDNYILSFYARAISGTGTLMCDLNDGAPLLNGWTNNLITNEWVRIVVSGVPSGSASFIDLVSNSNTNRVIDFWGVQLEKGSFATSFIPTHGSTITRGADVVRVEGEEFAEFYNNATEHTTVMVGKRLGDTVTDGRLYSISDGTASQVAPDWDFNDDTKLRISTNVGGSSQMVQEILSWDDDKEFKIAAGMAVNNQIGVLNGTALAAADTNCLMPTGVDRLYFGLRGNEGNQGSLTIKRFMYYPKRLPDSQLVTLTS